MTQTKKITIYEMGGCCSTSLVNPGNYSDLERLDQDTQLLKANAIDLLRVNVALKPQSLTDEPALGAFLKDKGMDAFPVTVVDGRVVKSADLPSQQELSAWTGIQIEQNTATNSCCGK